MLDGVGTGSMYFSLVRTNLVAMASNLTTGLLVDAGFAGLEGLKRGHCGRESVLSMLRTAASGEPRKEAECCQ